MKKKEQGLFIVEFAIIGVVLFTVLLAVMELARVVWIWNTLDEATRRGARLAAVCPISDVAKVRRGTVFADPAGSGPANSPILRGLKTENVTVSYLDANGATPAGGATFENTRYVRVSVNAADPKFTVDPLIPFIGPWTPPTFETTIPAESMGYIPEDPPRLDCLLP